MRNISHGLILGFSLLFGACTAVHLSDKTTVPSKSASNLVFYAGDVNTEGWLTYSNEQMGFSLKYPKTFVVSEVGSKVMIKRNVETTSDKVTIMKVKSTLPKEVGTHLYEAGKIVKTHGSPKHPVESIIALYQSGDPNSWFMTYFISRESDLPTFPDYEEKASGYDIIVANIEAYPSEADIRAAREMDRSEDFLSEPQQILSTLQFTR